MGEDGTWRRRQRLEPCVYQPRKAKVTSRVQKLVERHGQVFPESAERIHITNTLISDFWPPGLWDSTYISVNLSHPVCGPLLEQPWEIPGGSVVKNSPANAGDMGSIPGSGRSLGEGNGLSTPVFLPAKSHGQRSLASYSPWGRIGHDWVTKQQQRKWISHATQLLRWSQAGSASKLTLLVSPWGVGEVSSRGDKAPRRTGRSSHLCLQVGASQRREI